MFTVEATAVFLFGESEYHFLISYMVQILHIFLLFIMPSDGPGHGTDKTVIHSYVYLDQMLCAASIQAQYGKCLL